MLKRSLALTTLAVLLGTAAHAVTIQVQSVSATAGDTPDICIVMPDNNGQVSGVQTDISWNSSCLSADSGGGDEAACTVNPATNRSTFRTKLLSPNSMRVIMLSINDTTPMPANVQQLFCCQFRVASSSGGSCPITLEKTIASNSTGVRLPVSVVPGVVSISGRASGQGSTLGGGGMGGGMMAPPVVTGGGQAAPGAGGSGATGSGGAVAPAGKGIVPAAPAAPAVPQMPQVPGMPAAAEKAEQAVQDAKETAGAVLGTPKPAGTPQKTAAAGTPSPKTTAKGTAKAVGTPTPEGKTTAAAGTPTPK